MTGKRISSRKTFHGRAPRGVSLVELLIVISLIGIVAGLTLSRFDPGIVDQLKAASQVVSADLTYARSLAVGNNSLYRVQFEPTRHRYWLEHSGTNPALNQLPPSPYRDPNDPLTRQTTDLRRVSPNQGLIELFSVRRRGSGTETEVTAIEFDSLGALKQSEVGVIWLAAGLGEARRYVPLEINPITGIVEIGELTPTQPPNAGSLASPSNP